MAAGDTKEPWETGEWIDDPWFLRPGRADGMFSRDQLEAMADAFRRVLPPDVCRRFLAQPPHGARIAPLFVQLHPWPWFLAIGIDLALVRPWEDDPDTLKRLQQPTSFHGATVEIEIRANAVRAGLRTRRPEPARDRSRPDLIVEIDGLAVQVEIKDVSTASASRVPNELEMAFLWGMPGKSPQGRDAIVRTNAEIRSLPLSPEGRDRLVQIAPDLFGELNKAFVELERRGWPEGVVSFGSYGTVEVVGPGDGTISFHLFENPEAAHDAIRVQTIARSATKQFNPALPAVVFLDMPIEVDAGLAYEALQRDVLERAAMYSNVDAILVRQRFWDHDANPPRQRWISAFVRGGAERLSDATMDRLAKALVPSPYRLLGTWP